MDKKALTKEYQQNKVHLDNINARIAKGVHISAKTKARKLALLERQSEIKRRLMCERYGDNYDEIFNQ